MVDEEHKEWLADEMKRKAKHKKHAAAAPAPAEELKRTEEESLDDQRWYTGER